MKKLTFLLAFCIASVASAQDYLVAHISGCAQLANGEMISIGQSLSKEDQIRFDDPSTRIVVINQDLKRYQLVPEPATQKGKSPSAAMSLKRLLREMPRTRAIQMTTSGMDQDGITDFEAYFGNDRFYIIGDTFKIKVKKTHLLLDSTNLVVYRFDHKGDIVQKRILHDSSNRIIVAKSSIYQNNDEFINHNHIKEPRFYHFDKSKTESKVLASVLPVFIDEKILARELNMLIQYSQTFQGLKGEKLLEELCTFVFDVYGKTDVELLKNWIREHTVYEDYK